MTVLAHLRQAHCRSDTFGEMFTGPYGWISSIMVDKVPQILAKNVAEEYQRFSENVHPMHGDVVAYCLTYCRIETSENKWRYHMHCLHYE
jgi:hypothetical protein